jgi:predicted HicB family RNase H-like nuclease
MLKHDAGYVAEVEIDWQNHLLIGRVVNVPAVIAFEADTPDHLEEEFHKAVADYVEWCRENNVEPEKPLSGNILFRAGEELHRKIVVAAHLAQMPINTWLKQVVDEAISRSEQTHLTVSASSGSAFMNFGEFKLGARRGFSPSPNFVRQFQPQESEPYFVRASEISSNYMQPFGAALRPEGLSVEITYDAMRAALQHAEDLGGTSGGEQHGDTTPAPTVKPTE